MRHLRNTHAGIAVLVSECGRSPWVKMNGCNVKKSLNAQFPCSHSANGCWTLRDLYDGLPKL
jgi:hypothetical protein